MPKVSKTLKIVEMSHNAVVEEKQDEGITDAQELTMMKEEIDDEKGITEKVNNEMNEKIEEHIEIPIEIP